MVLSKSLVDTNNSSNQTTWSNSSSSSPQISEKLTEIPTRNGETQPTELRKNNSANRVRRVSSSSNLEKLSEAEDDYSESGKNEVVEQSYRTKIVLNDGDVAPVFASESRTPEVRKRKPRTRLSSLNPERRENYTELFNRIDKQNHGKITAEDAKGFTTDTDLFMDLADTNKDGWIYKDEFIAYCHENEKRLNKLFDEIDESKDGLIDLPDLQRAFDKADVKYTDDQLKKIIQELDRKGTPHIDREEFIEGNLLLPTSSTDDFIQNIFERTHGMDFEQNPAGSKWYKFMYSFPGSAAAKTLSAPADRLKIFYQVYGDQWVAKGEKMKLSECYRMLKSEGGYAGLFRGNGINVFKSMPEQAVKLECNKWIRAKIKRYREKYAGRDVGDNTWDSGNFKQNAIQKQKLEEMRASLPLPILWEVAAGGLSGLAAQTVVYPADTLKVRVALSKTNEYKNTIDAVRSVYAEKTRMPFQICNFYRGYFSSLGVILYVAVELTTYNQLKPKFRKTAESMNISPHWGSGLVSFTAPAVGTICSYPLQLIRTKYQSDRRPKMNYRNFCMLTYKEQGVRGFYTGLIPNLAKSVISGSIILSWWSWIQSREEGNN